MLTGKTTRLIAFFLIAGTLLFTGGGVLVLSTHLLSAQSPDEEDDHGEDTGRTLTPADFATPLPRPDESSAQSLDSAKRGLQQNDDLAAVLTVLEAGDVPNFIALARKGNYCAQPSREPLPECKSTDDVPGIYQQQIAFLRPILRPVEVVEKWLTDFLANGRLTLEFASRDSRLPEGDGGVSYLVFP